MFAHGFLKFENQDLAPRFSLIRVSAIIGVIRHLSFFGFDGFSILPHIKHTKKEGYFLFD
jgi:hypothetical protein